jgi:hypothetical protein
MQPSTNYIEYLMKLFTLLLPLFLFINQPLQAQWVECHGPFSDNVIGVRSVGQLLFATTVHNGVFRSGDNGATWLPCNTGISNLYMNGPLVSIGTTLFACGGNGLFRSTDLGGTWVPSVTSDVPLNWVLSGETFGSNVFVGTYYGKIFMSPDTGASWIDVSTGLGTQRVFSMAAISGELYACTGDAVYRWDANSKRWDSISGGVPLIDAIAGFGRVLIAGAWNSGIYRSTDHGASWVQVNTGTMSKTVRTLAVCGSTILAGTDRGIFVSADSGANWNAANTGLTSWPILSLGLRDSIVYAGAQHGIYRSADLGAHWEYCSNGMNLPSAITWIYGLAKNGSTLYAATSGYGLFASSDNGVSWMPLNAGPNMRGSNVLALDSVLLFGTEDGVYRSMDKGMTWSQVASGFTLTRSFAVLGADIFMATEDGILRSSDRGATWMRLSLVPGKAERVFSVAVCGTYVFAGSQADGVFRSSDHGVSWTSANSGLGGNFVRMFAASGSALYAGTDNGGVYVSMNNGTTWAPMNFGGRVGALVVADQYLFVGVRNAGVYRTANNGVSWEPFNDQLRTNDVMALLVSDGTLYAGTIGAGVFRRPYSEVNAVEPSDAPPPEVMTLDQNYPNPFNPSTTISFSLPSRAFVTLKVFDVMGRDVATVVSEEMQAGNYARQWNASGMPSGVYFYRLQAGAYSETKQLIIIK